MKVKVSEASAPVLDWMVANPGKVSRYMPLIARIHRQSSPKGACREWLGKRNEHGYGICKHQGKERRAHRLLYFAMHPDADKSLVVRHTCDNSTCVRPEHLVLGTQRDNIRDMHERGRFNGGAKPGNQNSVGNTGWKKGGAVFNRTASKLGNEVEVPEGLL